MEFDSRRWRPRCNEASESAARFVAAQILHAVAKQILLGQLLHKNDARRHKNRSLPGTVRRSNFNQRLLHVPAGALEAQAPARNVLALDEFFAPLRVTHQPHVIHLNARILTPINARETWLMCRLSRGIFCCRQSKHRGSWRLRGTRSWYVRFCGPERRGYGSWGRRSGQPPNNQVGWRRRRVGRCTAPGLRYTLKTGLTRRVERGGQCRRR